MEILLRLRVLIWLLILSLWGVLVYQFLADEEQARMQPVAGVYRGRPAPQKEAGAGMPHPPPQAVPPAFPHGHDAAPLEPGSRFSSLDYVKPLPAPPPGARPLPRKRAPSRARTARRPARRVPAVRPAAPKVPELPVPEGFYRTESDHFVVFSEGDPPSPRLLEVIESLHSNLMLDLASFSPWANVEKVTIYLFRKQETYRKVTGRPPWSGGATSVPKRKVYVYDSDELAGILAHELCHIYYDGFFLGGAPNPLWLSEGMATLVQVERGLAAPSWLRENLALLERGGGYSIEDLLDVQSIGSAEEKKVRLWYAQAYSTVRFLIRTQYKANFYKFSRHLRDGLPPAEALYRAYGMPFNRLKALEYAWRYDLTSSSLSRLAPADR